MVVRRNIECECGCVLNAESSDQIVSVHGSRRPVKDITHVRVFPDCKTYQERRNALIPAAWREAKAATGSKEDPSFAAFSRVMNRMAREAGIVGQAAAKPRTCEACKQVIR